MRTALPCTLALLAASTNACVADREHSAPSRETAAAIERAPSIQWRITVLEGGARFRPAGWSDDSTLWGISRGRLTRFDLRTDESKSYQQTAWSVNAARGVVGWRNENGTWMMRGTGDPIRLAGAGVDSSSGFDGPPAVLWSRDGTRALLSWQGEWDARHRLLERDGTMRHVRTSIPGYFGNGAVLWLDSTRVLFQTVAMGAAGKEPEYRESGWRGDLAVLDLGTGGYTRVTNVADSVYLRVVGPYLNGVLVGEWDASRARGYWRYDPRTWERREVVLPAGRAIASSGEAVVVVRDNGADSSDAVLVSGNEVLPLGTASRDAVPVFTPSGSHGALATGRGLVLFTAARPR